MREWRAPRRRGVRGRPTGAALLGALVILAVLVIAKSIFIPVAIAVLAATLLGPVVARLDDRLGRTGASALVVTAAVAMLGGAAWLIGLEVGALARELPDYSQN